MSVATRLRAAVRAKTTVAYDPRTTRRDRVEAAIGLVALVGGTGLVAAAVLGVVLI